jgi:hypothetical protein
MGHTANSELTESPVDIRGRRHVEAMTDRELLEETVKTLRSTQDTVEAFIESMSKNPMLKMFASKFGG